jgi:hypothetical protein
MTAAVKADVVLQQLNSDFERSKFEQIYRFLKDQEELNHAESMSVASCDVSEDESDDVSDTETLLNQRLDLHRVRPQSAKGWQMDNDLACIGKNIAPDEFPSKQPKKIKSKNNVHARERGSLRKFLGRALPEAEPCSPCMPSPENSPPFTRKPSFRHRKLRVAKPPPTMSEMERPRTATGTRIRSKGAEHELSLNLGAEEDAPRLRNSAPAALSHRQHQLLMDDDRSYLRMGDAGQLMTPREQPLRAAGGQPKLADIFSQSKKVPSYSKMNTEPQLPSHNFDFPASPLKSRKPADARESTRKSRGEKFVSSVKLPPLEGGGLNNSRDRTAVMPDLFHRS